MEKNFCWFCQQPVQVADGEECPFCGQIMGRKPVEPNVIIRFGRAVRQALRQYLYI